MKTLALTLTLTVALSADVLARGVQSFDMKALMTRAELVLVGKIKSVEWSGITTELTYPTWDVVFEWLKVEVEVIEPIKGTKKGGVVRTLMLSTRGRTPIANAPGMVRPEKGQLHLHCLLPTKIKSVYASITAPFDDNEGIFILDRQRWSYGSFGDDPQGFDPFSEYGERCKAIWSLVDDNGQVMPNGAEELRRKYKAEIAMKPSKDAIIHIKWKKETSPDGWQWNVPVKDDGKAKQGGADEPAGRSKAK